MAGHIGVDFVGVVIVVGNGVGPWANQGHVALQDVEQLRQFVNRRAADKAANTGDARVFTGGLFNLLAVVGTHGAELPDVNHFAVPAVALLFEQYRPGGRLFDGNGGNQQQRAEQDDGQQGGQPA